VRPVGEGGGKEGRRGDLGRGGGNQRENIVFVCQGKELSSWCNCWTPLGAPDLKI
jgi:hypothetical protein